MNLDLGLILNTYILIIVLFSTEQSIEHFNYMYRKLINEFCMHSLVIPR